VGNKFARVSLSLRKQLLFNKYLINYLINETTTSMRMCVNN